MPDASINESFTSDGSSCPPAPLIKRMMAMVYDLFILFAVSMIYGAAATGLLLILGAENTADYQPMHQGYGLGLGWIMCIYAFFWFFWRRAGQTVGMRAWRLKIVRDDGDLPSHKQITLRLLVAPFSIALVGIGCFWCLFNAKKATWQDLASNTHVVVLPKLKKTDPLLRPSD